MALDEDPLIGQVVDGRFEILARLGNGGMGTVYLAKQRSIGREIALKLIDRRFEGDAMAVKRFLREAKLASQLSHPNIVTVVDFGQSADGRLYIAMELLRGRTLHDELAKRGPFPLARLARYGTQIIDALETAHALSIVHRDLKLENVMILEAPGDLVKLLDFGLARSFTDPETRATDANQFSGTPRYIAPEVIEGAEPAPAQDVYALGVMLVELATGKSPFEAPTLEAMFKNKMAGVVQLDSLDSALRPIVARMLAARPGERPAHKEIRAALAGLVPAPHLGPPALDAISGSEPVLPAPGSEAFAAPSVASDSLELETAWADEKARKQAMSTMAKSPARSMKPWIITAIVLVVGGIIAAGVVVQMHHKDDSFTAVVPRPEGMVGIQVRANPTAQIRIDGHKAGKTPLTLHMHKSTQPVRIEAVIDGRTQTKLVVPDQDQDVGFTR